MIKKKWLKKMSAALACMTLTCALPMAGTAPKAEAASEDYVADREERLAKWYDDAQIGMMLHWGMLSGTNLGVYNQNFKDYPYKTVAELNEAVKDVNVQYWVDEAKKVGADYITFAGFHSGLGYIRPWKSDVPGIPCYDRDFLRELIAAAHQEDIKVVVYMTTSLNHVREDLYDWYDGDAYVDYAKENHAEYAKEKNNGKELTEQQWQDSFNLENNSYGFGAFTFDEIENLLTNYEIDGLWFDAMNNPTWYAEDSYPFAGRNFDYDGCGGYTDENGQHQDCTDPNAHRQMDYSESGFKSSYFYKRDILKHVHSLDSDCVTFVNNFPPIIDADVVAQETYSHGSDYRIITPGSNVKEALYVTGTTTRGLGVAWWCNITEDPGLNKPLELKRIVHAALAGGCGTIAQGPLLGEGKFPEWMSEFNDYVAEFNSWSQESWLDDELERGYLEECPSYMMISRNTQKMTKYVHLFEKVGSNGVSLEDSVQPIESITDLYTGEELSYERRDGKLVITVSDWSSYEKYGDTIIKIQYQEPTTENVTELLEETLSDGSVEVDDNYRMVLPELPEGYSAKLSFTSDQDIIGLSGIVNQTEDEQEVVLRLTVTGPNGETSETSDISVTVTGYRNSKSRIPQTEMKAEASSKYPHEDGAADKALDGNNSTYWHSDVAGADGQYLILDLGEVRSVVQLDELPRQNLSNGLLLDYELYGSKNGQDYSLVKSGSFEENNNEQSIVLDEAVDAKYLKLVAKRASANNDHVSIAEINVWEQIEVNTSPKEIMQEKLLQLVKDANDIEKELYQFPAEDQQGILETVENARDVQINQDASFEDIVLAAESLQEIFSAERKDGTYNVEIDFEDEETLTSFENYTKNEGGSPGKGELVSGGSAVSGAQSMKVFNDSKTAWSNGVITKAPLAVNAADGIVFRLKVSAGNAVKPMFHVNDAYDNDQNKDMLSGFTLMDTEGQMVTEGYAYDSSWGKVTFNSDFDGYMFIPYTEEGIKGFSEIKEEDDVYLAFHFEHMPSYAPEFIIDDVGTYFGTDLAAVLADLNAQRSEHAVKVTNGKADKAKAMAGELITVTADKAPEGSVFQNWENTGIFLNDEQKSMSTVTFIMPANDVMLSAVYQEEGNNVNDTPNENGSNADYSDNKNDTDKGGKDTEKNNSEIPKTGDTLNDVIPVAVLIASLVTVLSCLNWKMRKGKKRA